MTFFDCTANLVGQLNGNGQKGMLQIDIPPVENFWLCHCFIRGDFLNHLCFYCELVLLRGSCALLVSQSWVRFRKYLWGLVLTTSSSQYFAASPTRCAYWCGLLLFMSLHSLACLSVSMLSRRLSCAETDELIATAFVFSTAVISCEFGQLRIISVVV